MMVSVALSKYGLDFGFFFLSLSLSSSSCPNPQSKVRRSGVSRGTTLLFLIFHCWHFRPNSGPLIHQYRYICMYILYSIYIYIFYIYIYMHQYLPPPRPPQMVLVPPLPPVVGVCCEEGGTRCSKCIENIEMYKVCLDCI